MPDPALTRRLRWRCRRGMRELDTLLERHLDRLLADADANAEGDSDALAGFERLLACEDDALWRWCLGHETAPTPELAVQVDALRAAD